MLPMRGEGQVNFIVPAGAAGPPSEHPSANFRFIAPEYFEALEIAIERGRAFADDERRTDRPAPVVVSASVAERLWPAQDPLGKRFSRGIPGEQEFEVVGVATDARTTAIERTPPLMVYVPYWWGTRTTTSLIVKTAVDPLALGSDLRRAVQIVDPEIAVGQVRTLQDLVDDAVAGRRYQAELFVVFGLVALFIATLGIYAVTSYSLSRRRREMNIRVALGANRNDVLGLVVRQTSLPLIAGLLGGIAGALAIGGSVASLLYEVRPRDPVVLTSVAALVAIVALAATMTAARRGLSLDPMAALRDE
jgi:hypothetical protein